MSKLPSEESDTEKEKAQAKYANRIYKCFKCGKTETGKNLEDSVVNNYQESWWYEYYDNDTRIGSIGLLEPKDVLVDKTDLNNVSIIRAYCAPCGKTRARELELLDIEVRKVKALEKIGNAFKNSDSIVITLGNIGTALDGIGTALDGIASELHRFNKLRE